MRPFGNEAGLRLVMGHWIDVRKGDFVGIAMVLTCL